MKIRTFFLIIVIALVALFVALNWGEFLRSNTLSLLFGKVQVPLGLIMLGFLIICALVFFIYALYLRATVLLKERQLIKELEEAKKLAEKAEQSRFNELKELVENGFNKLGAGASDQLKEALSKIDKYNSDLVSAVNDLRKTD